MKVLPREVLRKIFAKLTRKDLYTCMFVFRALYPELSAVLYQDLVWRTRYDQQHVLRILTTRIDGSTLGKYLKTIRFENYGPTHPNITSVDFERLVYYLPYLHTITISPQFVKFLNNTPTNKFNAVREITMIGGTREQQDIDTHFTTNLRLKDQITTLKLGTLNITMLEGVYSRMLPLLSEFKVLTALSIREKHSCLQEEQKCISITSIISNCSNLKFLEFRSKCDWTIPTTENSSHVNLSTVSIGFQNLAEQHMEYMMQCLPNIRELYLYFDIQSRKFKDTTVRVESSVAKEFSIYLERMDYVEIHSGPLYPGNNPLWEEEAPSLYTPLVKFWDLVRVICGEGGYCYLMMSFSRHSSCGARIRKKEYKNLEVYFEIPIWAIMDTATFWARQLDFLTFTSVEINDNGIFDDDGFGIFNDDLLRIFNVDDSITDTRDRSVDTEYSSLVEPFIKLLLHQQNDQVPPIYVGAYPQLLVFHHSSIDDVLRSEHTANRSAYDYGYIQCFTLRNSMLNDLGQLYSQVKYLIIRRCILTKEDGIYQIDLSTFTNVLELEIDFNAATGFGGLFSAYIHCVNILNPQASTLYYYRNYILENLGTQEEVPIRRRSALIQIHHVGLENIVIGPSDLAQ